MRVKYHHLPESRTVSRLSKWLRRSPLIQIVFGVLVGYSLTSTFRWEESVHDVADKILTVVKSHNDSSPIPDFFLRCVVMIERKTQKPTSFTSALAEGWTRRCNETIFYTNSKNVAKVVKDLNVVLIDSPLGPFHWQFYKAVVDHAAKTPVSWTLVADEMLFVMVENLRKSLADMEPTKPIVVGRIMESRYPDLISSLMASFFPLINWRSVSVEAGVVFSNGAVDAMVRNWDTGFLDPRSTGRALFSCAQSMGVQLVDPVDEDGSHLFHDKNMKSLIGKKYPDRHEGHGEKSCCSEHAATFGGMSYKEQRVAEYANYHVRVFGNEGTHEYVPTTTVKPTTKAAASPKKAASTEAKKNVTAKV
ncbi:hypothetical protein PRIPAC_94455 [Pristionchus pacificus]|uniref:Uncharacterized protein n=1 Tax=Pristionchus pacificus TaxID=54126 RepID=A0A2A6CDZ5_PRIPA|nr:hypothetical protein PRIPAC_94455 [Pristionchus pacificus]|eukprot:PDM76465.1 hypothetical protein PRIPAC_40069 [Pristionchus pacificus]